MFIAEGCGSKGDFETLNKNAGLVTERFKGNIRGVYAGIDNLTRNASEEAYNKLPEDDKSTLASTAVMNESEQRNTWAAHMQLWKEWMEIVESDFLSMDPTPCGRDNGDEDHSNTVFDANLKQQRLKYTKFFKSSPKTVYDMLQNQDKVDLSAEAMES